MLALIGSWGSCDEPCPPHCSADFNLDCQVGVADLLVILAITKQSLGRVLKQLVDEGYVEQTAGTVDRRERLLFPTERGRQLAERLAAPQMKRIARSLEDAGSGAREAVREFLFGMISEADRPAVAQLLATGTPRSPENGDVS